MEPAVGLSGRDTVLPDGIFITGPPTDKLPLTLNELTVKPPCKIVLPPIYVSPLIDAPP